MIDNVETNKEINIYFDVSGEDLQRIIDNLLLEIYMSNCDKVNCNIEAFGV